MDLTGLSRIELFKRKMKVFFELENISKEVILPYGDYPDLLTPVRELVLLIVFTQEDIIYNFLADETMDCKRCGTCCRIYTDILVSPEDIERIASFSNITVQDFTDNYTLPAETWFEGFRKIKKDEKGNCLFLKKDSAGLTSCSIYSVRPDNCKNYKPHNPHFVCRMKQTEMMKNIRMIILSPLSMTLEKFSSRSKKKLDLVYREYPFLLNKVKEIRNLLKRIELKFSEKEDIMSVGRCSSCGYCCIFAGPVSLTEEEGKFISEFLGLSEDEFKQYFVESGHSWTSGNDMVLRKNRNNPLKYNWCLFLEKEGDFFQCSILPVRPDSCRNFTCKLLQERVNKKREEFEDLKWSL